jgi:hypothetical protein
VMFAVISLYPLQGRAARAATGAQCASLRQFRQPVRILSYCSIPSNGMYFV